MYQNRITLIGFLGRDADVRNTRNNSSYTVLSLATKASWKDHDGEWQSRTEWHRCIVWGKFGEFAATLTKGMHLQVEGELRSREYRVLSAKLRKAKSNRAGRYAEPVCVRSLAGLTRMKSLSHLM